MSGVIHKVYEETYKGYAIEISKTSFSAPYGPVHSYLHFGVEEAASQETSNALNQCPPEECAAILAEARAYCDREIEMLERRGDEMLSLNLSYREAKTLLRACRVAWKRDRIATWELQKRIESILEEPPPVPEKRSLLQSLGLTQGLNSKKT